MNELKQFRWGSAPGRHLVRAAVVRGHALKYWAGLPLAVRIVGSVHGLLFVVFLAALFRAALERDWPVRRWGLALLSSLVPFETFVFDRSLRRELLEAP